MSDAVYDALIERADWLRAEYLAGGNFAILSAKEQECRYIAKKFIKSETVPDPRVKALVEAARAISRDPTSCSWCKPLMEQLGAALKDMEE